MINKNILLTTIFCLCTGVAFAIDTSPGTCKTFLTIESAKKYYTLNKKINKNEIVPVMVINRSGEEYKFAGLDERSFFHTGDRIREINQIIQKKVIHDARKKVAEMFYLIDNQQADYGMYEFYHPVKKIPTAVASITCRKNRCSEQIRREIKNDISLYIQKLKDDGIKRYSVDDVVMYVNERIEKLRELLEYSGDSNFSQQKYIEEYFNLFRGEFGALMVTPFMRKMIGPPISQQMLENGVVFDVRITRLHVRIAFKEYLKLIKRSWKENGGIFDPRAINKISDIGEDLKNNLIIFSKLINSAPDIVADTFIKNPIYNSDFCWIMNEIDDMEIEGQNRGSVSHAKWYLTPVAIGLIGLPVFFASAPLSIIGYSLFALNVYTGADLYKKGKKIFHKEREYSSHFQALTVNGMDRYNIDTLDELGREIRKKKKTLTSIATIEIVGMAVGIGIIKQAGRVIRKMSRNDVSHVLENILEGTTYVGGSRGRAALMKKGQLREVLYSVGIRNLDDLDKFIKVATDKEIFKLLMKTKGSGVGKKVFISENSVEAIKQGYYLVDGDLFIDVNPFEIMKQGLLDYGVNNEMQNRLNREIRDY